MSRVIHGFCKNGRSARLYRIWGSMKRRCDRSTHPAYHRYGGRGIKVCEEWHGSFEAFRDWALAAGYADDLTIDRIDNDLGYSPSNCRWSTMLEQATNKVTNRYVQFQGEPTVLSRVARELKMAKSTVRYFLSIGRTVEEIAEWSLLPRRKTGPRPRQVSA